MKRQSIYANMTASDLARVSRERGLEKPNVITLSEWADFLEADDARTQAKQAKADEAADTAPIEPVNKASAPEIEPKDKKGK